ncbi:MAG TPA: TerB family tellurite resistance protein [Alphaproteobacteria bacterium]|nr:TerB family tellurite resistance protein [Alphaproteobacteria bacterium]
MSNSRDRDSQFTVTPAELMAAHIVDCKEKTLDAVLTAMTLVAAADGWIDPAERHEMVAFLKRNDLLRVSERDMKDEVEQRIRELREPGHVLAAAYRLGRSGGPGAQRLAVAAAWDVAVADSRVDPRELRMLDLIRATMQSRRARPAALQCQADEGA